MSDVPSTYIRHGLRAHHRSQECDECARGTTMPLSAVVVGQSGKRSHYKSKATVCILGHAHQSKVEAKVCPTIYAQFQGDGWRVYRNARLPLWALAAADTGVPMYCNVDFVVVGPGGKVEAIYDAKSPKDGWNRSPEWARGKAAVESTYGVKVEERSA